MMRLISVDIQKTKTTYHFRDQEAIDNYREIKTIDLSDFIKTQLGEPFIPNNHRSKESKCQ